MKAAVVVFVAAAAFLAAALSGTIHPGQSTPPPAPIQVHVDSAQSSTHTDGVRRQP